MLITVPAGQPLPPGEWAYAVIDRGGAAYLADSASELVAHIVGESFAGYRALGHGPEDLERALEARTEFLAQVAGAAQRALAEGKISPTETDEQILTGTYASKAVAFEGDWAGAIPLVALATHYEPYTDRPRPLGEVMFVDPSTELTFLQSLESLGLLQLWMAPLPVSSPEPHAA